MSFLSPSPPSSSSLSLSLPPPSLSPPQTAAPKRWIAYDGNVTEMNTPYTLRAQQLRDLYHSLTSSGLASDERLDLLLTLKCTVKVGRGEGGRRGEGEKGCKCTLKVLLSFLLSSPTPPSLAYSPPSYFLPLSSSLCPSVSLPPSP